MKAKESVAKRTIWPPRRTPKRKRALVLLQEWAASSIEVEFAARNGVIFTGTISEMSFERGTGFLFRNDHGVHSLLSTDLYDQIEITQVADVLINISFSNKDERFQDGFSIKPKRKRPSHEADLLEACSLFRQWIRLETLLKVHVGDAMRITMSRSKVEELAEDLFMFTIADTETVHIVAPMGSHAVFIDRKGDRTSVSLINSRSGALFTATDGMESPEEVINRFKAQTTKLQ